MKFFFTLLSLCFISISYAQDTQNPKILKDTIQKLDEIILNSSVMFGNQYVAKNRTGSSYFISPKELRKFNYTDISRVLRTVPGVNLYEEDGFGLRPNISLRGTSPDRSSKISIMEDGVLIAPAPYSAPAAYYFPSVARMESVEILKGSSQVQYGPFTTGGAINFVSTTFPDSFKGYIRANYGSFNTGQLHAKIGDKKENFGYMMEYLNYNSDGFKSLPNGADTGFDKNDVVAKFRVNTSASATIQQAFEVKFQYADESSDETYLGLSNEDFERSPFSRYAGSQLDKNTTEHLQLQLNHTVDFTPNLRVTTTGYYNGFKRNWFRLNSVSFDGENVGISEILENPTSFSNHFDIITGATNGSDNSLRLRSNDRKYISKGVQTKFDYHIYGENVFHDIEIGMRYHYDEEDRFQKNDGYNIVDGIINLTNPGAPGSNANRIDDATAFAAFAMYKFKYKNLTLTPGIRYENINFSRTDYGANDPNRTGINLSTRENKVDIFIPGIGFNYKFTEDVSAFGGVHKGFAPPSNQEGQKAEESINYELGSRFGFAGLRGEIVGFYNDYNNLLGSDLAASGGSGSLDQFNAGAIVVKGIEVLLNYNLLSETSKFALPLSLSYTLTDTEFLTSFGSEEGIWGEVTAGDELPYIAKHQFNASISLEHKDFELNLSGRFNGRFRTVAGSGSIAENESVDSNFIIDFSGKYHFNKYLSLTGNIINLMDETYAVSRVPSGLRPGHPFGAYAGLEFRF